jgi:hypothetical protein
MTLRDQLKHRMRWAAAFSIVGAAVLLPSVVAFLATHAAVFKATTALGAAIGFGGGYVARSFQCPKCGADIRESPAMESRFPWTVNDRPAQCPQCGVSFDDPRA